MNVMQELYDSEINFTISTMWDGGFDVSLGDEMNGEDADTTVNTAEEACAWLEATAVKCYPASTFTKARQ